MVNYRRLALIFLVNCILLVSCNLPKNYALKKPSYPNEFLQVYCEQGFNFYKAGIVTGTFKLPKNVDYKKLRVQILIPKLFRDTGVQTSKWSGYVSLPGKLSLVWNGGSLTRDCSKDELSSWAFINLFTGDSVRKLPVETPITYTFSYDAGVYTRLSGPENTDKLSDMQAHPENYTDFYKALFIVVEAVTKGN